jgi:hypothetical protein
MSADEATPLAIFGDPEGGHWAFILGGARPRLAIADIAVSNGGREPRWHDVTLERDDDQVWLVAGDDTDLKIELAEASTHTYEDGSALGPCRLTGTAAGIGSDELDLPGVLLSEIPAGKVDSTRIVGSWFPAGHEISLVSVRPKGAKGQDADHVDVIARGEDASVVFDPRLSTTYGPDGHPRKTGIELWVGEDEDGDQHPRRVSGVASGAHLTETAGELTVRAYAMHCLSRGDAGTGVYVLITR